MREIKEYMKKDITVDELHFSLCKTPLGRR
jgi:hypothetical protein